MAAFIDPSPPLLAAWMAFSLERGKKRTRKSSKVKVPAEAAFPSFGKT
jgi:hypothetical protein